MASQTTRDHHQIRQWAHALGATPAVVNRTGGLLRFEFAPQPPDSLADLCWRDFFQVFDQRGLELVYDDTPGSRFHKLVYPESLAAKARPRPASRPAPAPARPAARSAAPPRSPSSASSSRSPAAKPRLTRTGSKTLARKPPVRRRPKAA